MDSVEHPEALALPYHYKAFGLNIASDRQIGALTPCDIDSIDVTIEHLAQDRSLPQETYAVEFANWRAAPQKFRIDVTGIASYLVTDGDRILVRAESGTPENVIDSFLIGSAFAALLQQRRFLTLHASGVLTNAGAVLFIGRSGAGKSTTLAALHERGFDMVTDDVAAIRTAENNRPLITPSFPGGRVTAQTLERLGLSSDDRQVLGGDVVKYSHEMHFTSVREAEVARIFVLDIWDQPEISIEPVSATDAFETLSAFTFRKRFYDGMDMQAFHFEAMLKLAGAAKVYRVRRPDEPFMLDELVEALVAEIGEPARKIATNVAG